MSISGLAANAWTPAQRTQASDSIASMFVPSSLPASAGQATATPVAGGAAAPGQMADELHALLLQLQGGGSSATSDGTANGADPATSASDGKGVGAWLTRALQAYAPAAGPAGGLVGLAASAIA